MTDSTETTTPPEPGDPAEEPAAGDPADPRALTLARERHFDVAETAHILHGTTELGWDELTDDQRTTKIAEAADWIRHAYQACLLEYEPRLAPTPEQFAAIKTFLSQRCDEIDTARRDHAGPLATALHTATEAHQRRIQNNLGTLRNFLEPNPYGELEGNCDLEGRIPDWTPIAQTAWDDTLRCAAQYADHPDYAPETWTP
ncbi:hypothetical protein [Streptomyces sp. NPDC047315]|uniref:hypothetical protein n=1 Tax=Streptomyces sp. NPDC047315 TaxID=3155142 RepID=UPI0033E2C6D7